MNVFNNIRGPEYYAAQRKAAHQQYLQRRGITEEEYQLELEEKAKKEHQEYLDRLGITEEVFQRREKKAQRKRKIKDTLDGFGTFVLLLGGIALFVGGVFSKDIRNVLKPIVLTAGGIWLAFIIIMLCAPVYLIIYSLIERSKWNKFIKVIVSVILTLLVVVIIGLLLHTCFSGGGSDYYEPGKLRPNKF